MVLNMPHLVCDSCWTSEPIDDSDGGGGSSRMAGRSATVGTCATSALIVLRFHGRPRGRPISCPFAKGLSHDESRERDPDANPGAGSAGHGERGADRSGDGADRGAAWRWMRPCPGLSRQQTGDFGRQIGAPDRRTACRFIHWPAGRSMVSKARAVTAMNRCRSMNAPSCEGIRRRRPAPVSGNWAWRFGPCLPAED